MWLSQHPPDAMRQTDTGNMARAPSPAGYSEVVVDDSSNPRRRQAQRRREQARGRKPGLSLLFPLGCAMRECVVTWECRQALDGRPLRFVSALGIVH